MCLDQKHKKLNSKSLPTTVTPISFEKAAHSDETIAKASKEDLFAIDLPQKRVKLVHKVLFTACELMIWCTIILKYSVDS